MARWTLSLLTWETKLVSCYCTRSLYDFIIFGPYVRASFSVHSCLGVSRDQAFILLPRQILKLELWHFVAFSTTHKVYSGKDAFGVAL